MNKILTLTVAEPWFSMIKNGEKKEEYREIKPYWINRLVRFSDYIASQHQSQNTLINKIKNEEIDFHFQKYTHVLFINGYGANRPRVLKEIASISIGKPKSEWCPKEFLGNDYFIIKLR